MPIIPTLIDTHDLHIQKDTTLSQLRSREWLLANGSGAYAMGTVATINTRRYHGLFIACTQPPVGRVMLVNQMLTRIIFKNTPDQPVELTTCAFTDDAQELLHSPQGYHSINRFQKDAVASWTQQDSRFELITLLRLHWKEQAATLQYTLTTTDDAAFTLCPMVTLRDFHALRHASQDHGLAAQVAGHAIRYTSHDAKAVISAPGSTAAYNDPRHHWWHNVYYELDNDRGQGDHEDYYAPARFTYDFPGGQTHHFSVTITLGHTPAEPQRAGKLRAAHLHPVVKTLNKTLGDSAPLPYRKQFLTMLAVAADDFIVDRTIQNRTLSTILAGYPWFADWGRDTFISLPGLLLTTGRHDEARDVLHAFAANIRDGLVPNRFDDYDAANAHYNTVDASLWFINAALEYLHATSDNQSWNEWLKKACTDIITAYIQGTQYDIRMTGDGLITAGSPDTQLTWMDAACNGVVFTPRQGKAVEINALWYNALACLARQLQMSDEDTAAHYKKILGRIDRSFPKTFWNDTLNCLYDHVWTDDQNNDHIDASIRPNQVLIASLPFSPLPKTRIRKMLAVVREKLLTPYGLRTLPETDPAYHPAYTGPAMERDEAYHQGTIWPWLLGPFVQGCLRVDNFSPKAIHQAKQDIQPLITFMQTQGMGQLYEIHEAQPPHRPVGCPAQAWSVAQLLQTMAMMNTQVNTQTNKP